MLTQAEANLLIAMRKDFTSTDTITIRPGTDETFDLIGDDKRERFLLDLWRGTIKLSKVTYQTRSRRSIVLVRLDIEGSPHENPDGDIIACPHIHIYREGFEDKWAYSIDSSLFTNANDIYDALNDFFRYCNIQNVPPIQRELL